ncbi:hypothetical protein L1887_28620 [Cichorium endivia]|nr:hypothetical protein L1887_28620 [Cichorium endivia]
MRTSPPSSSKPQVLEDVAEVMQHIQSRLPEKTAALTSVLSKSWLHAWSTIPTLRFHVPNEQEKKHLKLAYIDRTLIRYLRDNIPIQRFDLYIRIENGESGSLEEKWIRSVATKTSLKELSLKIQLLGASFNLPEEILSGENVTKISVSTSRGTTHAVWMRTSHLPKVINCVSLRELHLNGVRISQQVLDHILSSCKLLAKIELIFCSRDLNTIKVKNLPCLDELKVVTEYGRFTSVEMNDVPNLRLFTCNLHVPRCMRFRSYTHSISLGSRLTQLSLGGPGLVTDNASLDMFKSGFGFPFLESLTLEMTYWTSGTFHFTCGSIKRFSMWKCPKSLIDIQVNALNMRFFHFGGETMPNLSFPISTTLEEITFRLRLDKPFGASFFLKMREALELSSKCDIYITTYGPPDMDLDDLKTRLRFPPAMNVQKLSLVTCKDECLWERSLFCDAFFEICHPKLVLANPDIMFEQNNHFCKLMLREVLEKKTTGTANWRHYLKHVQIKTRLHKKWETLSNSHRSFLDRPVPPYAAFKLEWT